MSFLWILPCRCTFFTFSCCWRFFPLTIFIRHCSVSCCHPVSRAPFLSCRVPRSTPPTSPAQLSELNCSSEAAVSLIAYPELNLVLYLDCTHPDSLMSAVRRNSNRILNPLPFPRLGTQHCLPFFLDNHFLPLPNEASPTSLMRLVDKFQASSWGWGEGG